MTSWICQQIRIYYELTADYRQILYKTFSFPYFKWWCVLYTHTSPCCFACYSPLITQVFIAYYSKVIRTWMLGYSYYHRQQQSCRLQKRATEQKRLIHSGRASELQTCTRGGIKWPRQVFSYLGLLGLLISVIHKDSRELELFCFKSLSKNKQMQLAIIVIIVVVIVVVVIIIIIFIQPSVLIVAKFNYH